VRIGTFEQQINVGAGRQFTVSKAHQRKARNRYGQVKTIFGSRQADHLTRQTKN